MSPLEYKEPKHISVLDGIRGLAVILILFHHSLLLPQTPTTADRFVELASRPLWIGVDLFFVLSGFLITGILSRTHDHPKYFLNFYARRSLRIFPLYFFSLFLFIVLFPALPWSGFDAYRSIGTAEKSAFWLYYINYFHRFTWPPGNLGHYWSLCVEEHFYLVWPMVLWLFRGKALVPALIGIVLTTCFRILAIKTNWWTPELGYHASHLRMDSILAGALAFSLQQRYSDHPIFHRLLKSLIIPLSLATVAVVLFGKVRSTSTGNLIGMPVINLTMSALLLLVLNSSPTSILNRVFSARLMLLAGKYSYAIYIFHFPLLYLAYEFTGFTPHRGQAVWPHAIVPVVIMFVGSALLATLSWHLLESRFLSLKRHFTYTS